MKVCPMRKLPLVLLAIAVSGCSTDWNWRDMFDDSKQTIYQSSPAAQPHAAYGQEQRMDRIYEENRPVMPVNDTSIAWQSPQASPSDVYATRTVSRPTITATPGGTIIGDAWDIHPFDEKSGRIDLGMLSDDSMGEVNKALSSMDAGQRHSWQDRGTDFQLRLDTFPTPDQAGQICRKAALIYRIGNLGDWQHQDGRFCQANPRSKWYYAGQ